eukprot:scaffold323552_cov32-Tisochrysis_lutea.AAC.2
MAESTHARWISTMALIVPKPVSKGVHTKRNIPQPRKSPNVIDRPRKWHELKKKKAGQPNRIGAPVREPNKDWNSAKNGIPLATKKEKAS